MKFEESLARLDEIIAALESGDAALEPSLELYKEGIGLAAECRGELDRAALTVTFKDGE